MKQYQQQQRRQRSSRRCKGAICMLLLSAALCSGACGKGEDSRENVTGSPAGTETPTPTEKPKSWIVRMLEEGRTELSRPMRSPSGKGPWLPVSASKTVRLGDFEYTATVPQTLFRRQELEEGTAVIEMECSVRYVGEKESVEISYGRIIGYIVYPSGKGAGGGRYDDSGLATFKKGEEMSIMIGGSKFSKEAAFVGSGVIAAEVDFNVLDENKEETGEFWRYLLAIPYDVVEEYE